jgi:uncharacterized protein with von Willebrand factor type A (vWA) domain
MKNEKDKVARKITQQILKCNLTDEELLRYGSQLADAQQTIVELEEQLKEFKEEMKAKSSQAESIVTRLSNAIRQRYEYRPVECTITKNYTTKQVLVTRNDTDEQVDFRKMNDGEMAELPLDAEEEGGDA